MASDLVARLVSALRSLAEYHEHMGECRECDKIVCQDSDDLWFAVHKSEILDPLLAEIAKIEGTGRG
jgi:hypothetical protein